MRSFLILASMLALLIFTIACGQPTADVPTPAVQPPPTQTESPPADTPAPPATQATDPTATPVPAEPTADPSPTQQPEPTQAPSPTEEVPAEERVLMLLYWQAPTLPGPYLSSGDKDRDAGAVTLEPMAKYDPDGNLVPALAAVIPTIENGGFSDDLKSITWKLREGLKWSDGNEVSAADTVFTWQYCIEEHTGCTASSAFAGVASVEAMDDLTVKVSFEQPTPYPYNAFVGTGVPIISRSQFEGCIGDAAVTCVAENHAPLGTGPYRITSFTPNEEAVYERNPHYRGEPAYFDRVVIKGGGDALAASRAVLEEGTADYAWNLQIEPDKLRELEAAGQGSVISAFSSLVERIVVNQTNPDPALGNDRSEYPDGENPPPVPRLPANTSGDVHGH